MGFARFFIPAEIDGFDTMYAIFLTFEASGEPPQRLADAAEAALRRHRPDLSGLVAVDLFGPHPDGGRVNLFDDPDCPTLMVQMSFASRDGLDAASSAIEGMSTELRCEGHDALWGAFRVVETPVAGADACARRTAPLSFMVRYYGPVTDPGAFVSHYVEHHPPILRRFPRIRNVFCYVPVDYDLPGSRPDGVIVGNEVVFDSVEDLNAALASDVITELRADTAGFPVFGHNTHHAMFRRTVSP